MKAEKSCLGAIILWKASFNKRDLCIKYGGHVIALLRHEKQCRSRGFQICTCARLCMCVGVHACVHACVCVDFSDSAYTDGKVSPHVQLETQCWQT